MVPVECYFVLSALLFFIGVFGFITRRNLIAMHLKERGCP
jgi:NADH-quinone oxidoreductase subunit K